MYSIHTGIISAERVISDVLPVLHSKVLTEACSQLDVTFHKEMIMLHITDLRFLVNSSFNVLIRPKQSQDEYSFSSRMAYI
jgi:hypothetical protein